MIEAGHVSVLGRFQKRSPIQDDKELEILRRYAAWDLVDFGWGSRSGGTAVLTPEGKKRLKAVVDSCRQPGEVAGISA